MQEPLVQTSTNFLWPLPHAQEVFKVQFDPLGPKEANFMMGK